MPGSWKMKKGVAQVEFMQGATVIFEGFVHADFVNSNAATLHLGKMRAHIRKWQLVSVLICLWGR